MKKKLLSLLLVTAMTGAVALTGCGGKDAGGSGSGGSSTSRSATGTGSGSPASGGTGSGRRCAGTSSQQRSRTSG